MHRRKTRKKQKKKKRKLRQLGAPQSNQTCQPLTVCTCLRSCKLSCQLISLALRHKFERGVGWVYRCANVDTILLF